MLNNYKNKFPFEIGTTSFIIPNEKDNLIENVQYLKNSFDKIQLLYFGKNYLNEVMGDAILKRLFDIKKESGIKYSIHLPLDLNLLDLQARIDKNLEIIQMIFNKTFFLGIDEYILHIDCYKDFKYRKVVLNDRIHCRMEKILIKLKIFLRENDKKILIENTSYDLNYFQDLIIKYNYNICMDIGHLFKHDLDFNKFLFSFKDRIQMFHLYGFKNGNDHISLNKTGKPVLTEVIKFLKNYKKSVIIEVFNQKDLIDSMKCLENYFIGDKNAISRISVKNKKC